LFGLLFEVLVIRDLRVMSPPFDDAVLDYNDPYGTAGDGSVLLGENRWGAIERKTGERACWSRPLKLAPPPTRRLCWRWKAMAS
jgi:hypothetical protein